MTGFSSLQETFSNKILEISFTWEIKSVNGRSLDIKTKIPSGYEELNQQIRQKMATNIKRGNVQANLQINQVIKEPEIKINHALLSEIIQLSLKIRNQDVDNFKKIAPEGLLAISGVIENINQEISPEDKILFNDHLLLSFDNTLTNMLKSRLEEGNKIKAFLLSNINKMAELCLNAEEKAKNISSEIMEKLKKQVLELLKESDIKEERIIQETAFLAIKADIKEELDRLNAHIITAIDLLKNGETIGRQFDFLTQEMLRETNTICSKSNNIELTKIALDLKVIIDQIKEQIQNIE